MKAILRSGFLALAIMLAFTVHHHAIARSHKVPPHKTPPLWMPPFERYTGQYGFGAYLRGDFSTALRVWRPLAELGDNTGQYGLGLLYSEGRGVLQNYILAHMWFNLAAAQGDKEAQASRDRLARRITPDQIAEAQRVAQIPTFCRH